MANPKTPLQLGKIYHIWTHANGDENLFRVQGNYQYFLEKYAYYIAPIAETFAYCLMPNHLHLMVRIKSSDDLVAVMSLRKPGLSHPIPLVEIIKFISHQFSHLFNGYTQAYNKMFDRRGSLFIPTFKRKEVNTKNYFVKLISYIHLNPVHHGFVSDLNDWQHSSWHAYLSDKLTKINRNESLQWFGDKKTFQQIHEDFANQDIWKEFDL